MNQAQGNGLMTPSFNQDNKPVGFFEKQPENLSKDTSILKTNNLVADEDQLKTEDQIKNIIDIRETDEFEGSDILKFLKKQSTKETRVGSGLRSEPGDKSTTRFVSGVNSHTNKKDNVSDDLELYSDMQGSNIRGMEGSNIRGMEGSNIRGMEGSNIRGMEGSNMRGFEGSKMKNMSKASIIKVSVKGV